MASEKVFLKLQGLYIHRDSIAQIVVSDDSEAEIRFRQPSEKPLLLAGAEAANFIRWLKSHTEDLSDQGVKPGNWKPVAYGDAPNPDDD